MKKFSAVKSPHLAPLLASHQYQGQTNDCGPYCTAIVVNALCGAALDGGELGDRLNGWVWRKGMPLLRRIPGWATLPWGITDELRQWGIKARWHPLKIEDDIHQYLAQGKVVFTITGCWKPIWGHYMLLVEYDPQKGWGFVNPASKSKKVFWIEAEKFRQEWKCFGSNIIEALPPE